MLTRRAVAPDSYSYTKGLVSSHIYPLGGSQTNFSYDGAGEPVSYTATFPTYLQTTKPTLTATATYSARGEITAEGAGGFDLTKSNIIRGYPATCKPISPNGPCAPGGPSVDAKTGAIVGSRSQVQAMYCSVVQQYAYDVAGRQTSETGSLDTPSGCGSIDGAGYNTAARTYDAENHLLTLSGSGNPSPSLNLNWGPNGHPLQAVTSALTGSVSLHWDGDQLLYTTDASGSLNQFFVGDDAVMFFGTTAETSAFVDDVEVRSSSQIQRITSYGHRLGDFVLGASRYGLKGQVIDSLDYESTGAGSDEAQSLEPATEIDNPRADGLSIGGTVIQGVREKSNDTGQWTTPDAYAGNIDDPQSLRSYMWNLDNPIDYADPSGNCAQNQVAIDNANAKATDLQEIGCVNAKPASPQPPSPQQASEQLQQFNAPGTPDFKHPPDMYRMAIETALIVVPGGKAAEFAGGALTESGFLRMALKFLKDGNREMVPNEGRFLSKDEMRQLRFGNHEISGTPQLHAHFEAYDKPLSAGGKVIENTRVNIYPDSVGIP